MSAQPTPGSPADDAPEADPVQVAKTILARQLAAGPRSRSQLEAALAKREVPASAAQAALDRFVELGYVDDAAFAAGWVASRSSGRGLGRRALAYELRRKGIEEPEAAAALAQLDPERERATAVALAERALPRSRGLDRATRVRRLSGMLARKGYPPGMVGDVVREVLAGEGGDEVTASLPG